ncbi:MAG TPA: hypothetical protein VMN60_06240 [Longimicrobiales bacterium]|nr:hypothetical protein [Longimicrobiales bacterium]
MTAAARSEQARYRATLRWIRRRFGDASFERLGLPGGDVIDAGLKDLAATRMTLASLAVSVAAPRLRREGIPVTSPLPDPEFRLYELLEGSDGELAHARYNALLRRVVSFADACRLARIVS